MVTTETRTTVPALPLTALEGACREQRKIVEAEWPEGVPLTEASVERAVELGLELWWAVDRFLVGEDMMCLRLSSRDARGARDREKHRAFAVRDRAMEAAWDDYVMVRDCHDSGDGPECQEAYREYRRARLKIQDEYDRACERANREYSRACGMALLEGLTRLWS